MDARTVLADLDGRTFVMTGTSTDAGGVDTMRPGLDFRITFSGSTATVTGDCALRYGRLRDVSAFGSARIVFGGLSIGPTACAVGMDPGGPPSGELFVHREGRMLYLGTGYVGWGFREVG